MAAFDQSFAAGAMGQSLDDIIKQKFLQQIESRRAMESQQQLGQGQQRIGLEGRRINQDAEQFGQRMGMDKDKLTEDRRQADIVAAQANQRIGMDKEMQPLRMRQMTAQTEDLNRQPQEAIDTRNFQTQRDKTQHGYQMGEIGAHNAGALQIAGMRPKAAPQVFYDETGKARAVDFSSGAPVEVPLPAGIVSKTAPKVAPKTVAQIEAEASARAKGTAQGKSAGGGGGILDSITGLFSPKPAATVNMKAPDGSVKAVPTDQVAHYKTLGAVEVP